MFVGCIEEDKGLVLFFVLMVDFVGEVIVLFIVYGEGLECVCFEECYVGFVKDGRLCFVGCFDYVVLFVELLMYDVFVFLLIWVENVFFVIVEVVVLGLLVLVNDIGSLLMFGDEIGNKIFYCNIFEVFLWVIDVLCVYFDDGICCYDWLCYLVDCYVLFLYVVFGID